MLCIGLYKVFAKCDVFSLLPGRVTFGSDGQMHWKKWEGVQYLKEWGGFGVQTKVIACEITIPRSNKNGFVPGERFLEATKITLQKEGEGKGQRQPAKEV